MPTDNSCYITILSIYITITCFTYIPVVSTASVWLVARHIFIHAYYQVYIPMHTNIH